MSFKKAYNDYRTSHVGKLHGLKYDDSLFKDGRFDNEIWKKEQVILKGIISKYDVKGRLMDFACGTGRIIGFLEDQFEESIGIDISQNMLDQAKIQTKHSKLICGDLTRNPKLIHGKFDCITCFRFFLNAEPSLRDEVFKFITNKLKNQDSILIFNIHGNKFSTRWFLVVFDKIFKRSYQNQISLKEVKLMLKQHDLEIVEFYGIGFIYKVFFKFMPKFFWRFFEDIFHSLSFLKPFSLYFVFVCKKTL